MKDINKSQTIPVIPNKFTTKLIQIYLKCIRKNETAVVFDGIERARYIAQMISLFAVLVIQVFFTFGLIGELYTKRFYG
jgi:hypothetical protein